MEQIDIYKLLDWMRDNAEKLAISQAEYNHLSDYRSVVKAQQMARSDATSAAAQERDAYCSEAYIDHLKVIEMAETNYLRLKFLMQTAQAKVDCWRSLSASARQEGKNVT